MGIQTAIKEPDLSWRGPVFETLPESLRVIAAHMPADITRDLEEIRIRENRPLMVYSHGRDYFLCQDGRAVASPEQAYRVTRTDTRKLLELISDFSIYAFEEEMRSGYITLRGGHRVGMAGTAVVEDGRIKTLKDIRSFNIRISREIPGAAKKALPFVVKGNNVCHTLVLSPPQMGKTTLLRDIARNLSSGFANFKGINVGIVDERSEIAGCYQGIPQKDVGLRTDVLDACPKAAGMIMMIRSMSPRVIITDEIGRPEDANAVEDALNAGIKVIVSAHGTDLADALSRPFLSSMLGRGIFECILILGNSLGVGTLEKVYGDRDYRSLLNAPVK